MAGAGPEKPGGPLEPSAMVDREGPAAVSRALAGFAGGILNPFSVGVQKIPRHELCYAVSDKREGGMVRGKCAANPQKFCLYRRSDTGQGNDT